MSKNLVRKGGVKTEAGKEVSKYNAQKHSILRESITRYEAIDIAVLYDDLIRDLKPKGKSQELMVEVIAMNTIKLTRVVKSESEFVKKLLSPFIKSEMDIEVYKPAHYEYQPRLDCTARGFMLFSRYQIAIENRIYKALSALKILQNEQS